MKVIIEVETVDSKKANPSRGYHDYITHIVFKYADPKEGAWIARQEEQLCSHIVGGKETNMWLCFSYKNREYDVSEYWVNHGYDSGD